MGSCKLRLAVVALLFFVDGALAGCASQDEGPSSTSSGTAGASHGGEAGASSAAGGSSGDVGGGSSGSLTSGGTMDGSGGGAGSAVTSGSGGGAGATGAGGADASGSGGVGGTGGGGAGPGGSGGSGTGGVAVCWPDSMVIKICHQLENACENCPPGGPNTPLANACFALVEKAYAGMADDAACEKFAIDNKCKVDSGGNVCGSLNCDTPGCVNKARCEDRKGWGDTSQCQPFLATCPCR